MTADQGNLEARVERLEKLVTGLVMALHAGYVADNPELALDDPELAMDAIHDDLVGLAED